MSVVFTDNFTVTSDTNLNAYPAGSPDYAYNSGSGSNLLVRGSTDRVDLNVSSVSASARIIDAAVPTTDYEITADVYSSGNWSSGEVQARCATGTHNHYAAKVELLEPNEVRLYRVDNGTHVLLASGDAGLSGAGVRSLSLRPIGTNPVVLSVKVNGVTVMLTPAGGGSAAATYSDSHANRKQSGPPGIGAWSDGHTVNIAWVDNVSVDNLVSGTNRTLTADAGTYAHAGQAADLLVSRRVAADHGSYTLTGQSASPRVARALGAESGTLSLTGGAATLRADRHLAGEGGTYTLAGQAADLVVIRAAPTLTAEAGTYAFTGQAAGLRAGRRLLAEFGTFTLAGQVATMTYTGGASPSPPSTPARIPVAGTRWYFNHQVDRRIRAAGAFSLSKAAYYRNIDFANKVWERNPDCAFADLDLSACAVYHTFAAMQPHAGLLTMVSWDGATSQHGVCNSHSRVQETDLDGRMYWVDFDTGEVYERSLVDARHDVGTGAIPTDLSIYKLNEPVPVNAWHVLPRDWQAYFPWDTSPESVPAWTGHLPAINVARARTASDGIYAIPPLHDSRLVLVREIAQLEAIAGGPGSDYVTVQYYLPGETEDYRDALRADWAGPGVRDGDSSSPLGVIAAPDTIILACSLYTNGSGPAAGYYADALDEAIIAMGDTGHRVRRANLGEFATVSPRFRRIMAGVRG